jgi:hypothetical protein
MALFQRNGGSVYSTRPQLHLNIPHRQIEPAEAQLIAPVRFSGSFRFVFSSKILSYSFQAT